MKQLICQLFLELLLAAVSIDSSMDAAVTVNIIHIELMELVGQ